MPTVWEKGRFSTMTETDDKVVQNYQRGAVAAHSVSVRALLQHLTHAEAPLQESGTVVPALSRRVSAKAGYGLACWRVKGFALNNPCTSTERLYPLLATACR